jgi:hypothetical protein
MRLLAPNKRSKRSTEQNNEIARQFAVVLFTKSDRDALQRMLGTFSRSDYEFFDEMMDIKQTKNKDRLYRFFKRRLTFVLDYHHWQVLHNVISVLPAVSFVLFFC